tara:strand:- start:230 stop:607 length:378 start_codon:yes stop_codon:yes gene_type:complete
MAKMNNLSYEKYLQHGLESISKNFNIKTYKLASQQDYAGFERGRDLRIQIRWKEKCIWEFVIEKSFWFQSNTNKEDRTHMRNWADFKIQTCQNAVTKKKPKQTKKRVAKEQIAKTQDLFEKMKKK